MYTTIDIIDKSMEKAKKTERLTKSTKFGRLFKNIANGEIPQDLSSKKPNFKRDVEYKEISIPEDEDFEYIVENPKEIQFDMISNTNSNYNLPFFKTLKMRLNEIYG